MSEKFLVGMLIMMLPLIAGFAYANLQGYFFMNRNTWERYLWGVIQVGFMGVIVFFWTQDLYIANLLTGLLFIGFTARCAWEYMLTFAPEEGLYR